MTCSSRRAGLVFLALLLAPPLAAAGQRQDPTSLSLEDLMATTVDQVSGASKFLQRVTDAPASVTVVTADDIELYGHRTLADVLRSVEGISISYDRNYTYLGLRGLSRPGDLNSRVLVLVDGHRMNNNVDGQAMLGTDFQLDVALIDRVEVIRGPSAVLYGSSAFSAVIAVVTKRAEQINGLELSASVATHDTTTTRATWGKRHANGLELLVSGATHRSDGAGVLFFPEFANADGTGGYATASDGDRADSMALSATAGNFTLHGLYARRDKQIPTASFGTVFNSAREQTIDDRLALDLQYTRELGQSTKLLARTYWDRSVYEGFYPYSQGDEAGSVLMNRDHFAGKWWGAEIDVTRRVRRAHNVTVGVEYRRNAEQSTLNYDEEPRVVYIDERPRTYTAAVSAQDEITISRYLLLNVAARGEHMVTGKTGFTPKAGLIVTPARGPSAKAMFSRALRAPTAYELHYKSPANEGNEMLEPERTQSLELELTQPLSRSMKVEGSIFRNSYRDVIVEVTDEEGAVTLQNGLDARATGVDVSWSMQRQGGMRARVSYATLFNADAASNAWTSGAPRHLAKVNVGGPLRRLGVSTGVEVQYESERHTHTGDVLPPAVVTNLNVVRRNLIPGVDLTASLHNAFDEEYSEPVSENHAQGSIRQEGRRGFVGLTWRLK